MRFGWRLGDCLVVLGRQRVASQAPGVEQFEQFLAPGAAGEEPETVWMCLAFRVGARFVG